MREKRGFITIATGDEWYYKIALNLLKSYKICTKHPLPFAILTNSENKYTKEFDDVIVVPETTGSYIDKLLLGKYLPYEETIFLDADCLAYSDLNELFDVFSTADDFSCLGSVLPLNDKDSGWYQYDSLPNNVKKQVSYGINLHGGMYYIRSSQKSKNVFSSAFEIADNYYEYKFKTFSEPADEPIFALAMAINHCKTVPFKEYPLACYWNTELILKARRKSAVRKKNKESVPLIHWGTRYTKTPYYAKQMCQYELLDEGAKFYKFMIYNVIFDFKILAYKIKIAIINLIEKLQKFILLRKIWHFIKGK